MPSKIDELKRRAEEAARRMNEKYEIKTKIDEGARIDREHRVSERVTEGARRAASAAEDAIRRSGIKDKAGDVASDVRDKATDAAREAKEKTSDLFGEAR